MMNGWIQRKDNTQKAIESRIHERTNSLRSQGMILRVLRRFQCEHYKPVFKPLLLGVGEGGLKFLSRGEKQGEKLLRHLSQLRPRIWPLGAVLIATVCSVFTAHHAKFQAMVK